MPPTKRQPLFQAEGKGKNMENVKIEELIKEISESQKEKLEEYIQELDSDEYLPSFDDLKEILEEEL